MFLKKVILCPFLCVCIVFFSVFGVYGELYSDDACEENTQSELSVAVESNGISVSAQACVLYCPDNGKVLFSKNENSKMKMASTTKIMTTLLTLEQSASKNKNVTFTKEMTAEGSSMYLQVDDVVTLRDLAKGMMAASGNDAANAAAITIAGSAEKFSELMNRRAKQIGMKNTNFVTPSGLDDDNHYSTAYDMALLMSYALENEDFANITSQKKVDVEFIKPENKKTTYQNHNRLLKLYEYCIGGKTGFTKAAGRCLVSAARKNNVTLVAVTLNAPDDWNDHINLYNYGFQKLKCVECDDTNIGYEIPIVGGEKDKIKANAHIKTRLVTEIDNSAEPEKKIYTPNFLYAPIQKGDKVGYIEYFCNGESVGKSDLYCDGNVEYKNGENKFISFIKGIFN